jgi:diguanylate cyclase (GGDEF)-like protein
MAHMNPGAKHAYLWGSEGMSEMAMALPADWTAQAVVSSPQGRQTLASLEGGILLVSSQSEDPDLTSLPGAWVVLELSEEPTEVPPPRREGHSVIFTLPQQGLEHILPYGLIMAKALLGDLLTAARPGVISDTVSSLGEILRVAGTFRAADSVEEAYDRITKALCTRFPFRRSMLFLLDGSILRLRSLSWPGGRASRLSEALQEHPPQMTSYSPEFESFTLGRSIPVDPQYSELFAPEVLEAMGPISEVALVPLFTDKDFVGVVEADFAESGDQSMGEGELALLEAFNTLVGSLLYNLRLIEELEEKNIELTRHIRELTVIQEVTRLINRAPEGTRMATVIVDIISDAMEADFGFVMLYDPSTCRLRLLGHKGLDQEMASCWESPRQVTKEQMEHFLDGQDFINTDGPLLIRPLQGAREPVGFWGVGRHAGKPAFNDGDRRLLEAVDQHAAVAINSLRMRLLATTDALTGLYTRRHLKEALEQELHMGRFMGYPVSVIMIDVDQFKQINDTFGHQGGDKVLVQLGAILKEGRREMDLPARLGGDEMALVLPRCDQRDARGVAEGLRQRVKRLNLSYRGRPIKTTVSIGLASQPVGLALEQEELMERADRALYQAKNSGRNQVAEHQDTASDQAGQDGLTAEA